MKIRGIRLPDTEMFPCSRGRVKDMFGESELDFVSFGHTSRTFRFDGQVSHRPAITGTVIAALSINRGRSAHLSFYPVRSAWYPESAQLEFSCEMLSRLHGWLNTKQSRPDTAIVGYETMIVEWTGHTHRCHELRPYL